jgi:hypothetical protein
MSIKDTLERLVWTVVAAAGAGLLAGPLISVSIWQGAAFAALTAAINFVTIVARARLAVLPNPGDGLPGLPTDDGGQAWVPPLVWALLFFLLGVIAVKAGVIH